MSESKHTPGPWIAEPGGGRGSWIKGANNEWSALSCGDTDTTAEANARLIAAAPEMLAALKGLTDYSRKPLQADWRAADEAIAKAEGR